MRRKTNSNASLFLFILHFKWISAIHLKCRYNTRTITPNAYSPHYIFRGKILSTDSFYGVSVKGVYSSKACQSSVQDDYCNQNHNDSEGEDAHSDPKAHPGPRIRMAAGQSCSQHNYSKTHTLYSCNYIYYLNLRWNETMSYLLP